LAANQQWLLRLWREARIGGLRKEKNGPAR
jgi:hypothetical protein